MSIPYDQSCSSGSIIPRLPYMRLPSYKSLRRGRYHPYSTTRTRCLSGSTDLTEPTDDADFEAGMLLDRINPILASLSQSAILEDDCLAGLRTVVSQMTGRDSARTHLGSVHLVIDFALIVRKRLRKSNSAVDNGTAVTLPPTATELPM